MFPLDDRAAAAWATLAAELRGAGCVAWAAGFWGLVVFMPVGLGYLACFLLMAAMALQRSAMVRIRRLRRHAMFLPLAVFVLWTLLVLALQPRWYAQTPSNLWHGMRIATTFALAITLTRNEARCAALGFVLALVFAVLVVAAGHAMGLPELDVWRNLLHYEGNKSISNALLFTVAAVSAMAVWLQSTGKVRMAAAAVVLVLAAVILLALPNRASLLILLAAPLAAAAHQWRQRKARMLAIFVPALVLSVAAVMAVPKVGAALSLGIREIRQAASGQATRGSWNVRVQMIRHTGNMMLARPWLGWGIGAWNEEWRKRAPAEVADLNMPHNDFLWMGAQAGVPGALAWLAVMLAACSVGWRRQDLLGRCVFLATLTLLLSALVNSVTRDAVIGLSMVWVVGIYVRLAGGNDADLALNPGAPGSGVAGIRPSPPAAPLR